MAWIITNPESATITPMIEYIKFFLAVSIIFSSPAAAKYWIPETTKAKMASIPNIPKIHPKTLAKIARMPPEGLGKPVAGIVNPLFEVDDDLPLLELEEVEFVPDDVLLLELSSELSTV